MWTHADKMWTDADCPQKCGQMRTINADITETRSMLRAMVWYCTVRYRTPPSGERVRYFEVIKLALVSVWMIRQELIFWTRQTKNADKRCGQMRTFRNNAEKCRQTTEICGQTADMREWKCFDIERLCLVTYRYLRKIFTIFFSCAKVLTVHST